MRATIGMLCAGLLCSCATLMHPGPDPVRFESSPPGATVYLDGAIVGVTPALVLVSRRRSSYDVRYELDGYASAAWRLEAGANGWAWLNLLFPLGLPIDGFSGNSWSYDERHNCVILTPTIAAPPE